MRREDIIENEYNVVIHTFHYHDSCSLIVLFIFTSIMTVRRSPFQCCSFTIGGSACIINLWEEEEEGEEDIPRKTPYFGFPWFRVSQIWSLPDLDFLRFWVSGFWVLHVGEPLYSTRGQWPNIPALTRAIKVSLDFGILWGHYNLQTASDIKFDQIWNQWPQFSTYCLCGLGHFGSLAGHYSLQTASEVNSDLRFKISGPH